MYTLKNSEDIETKQIKEGKLTTVFYLYFQVAVSFWVALEM